MQYTITNNVESLYNLAENMEISNTKYEHKDIHIITFIITTRFEGNQLDYITWKRMKVA